MPSRDIRCSECTTSGHWSTATLLLGSSGRVPNPARFSHSVAKRAPSPFSPFFACASEAVHSAAPWARRGSRRLSPTLPKGRKGWCRPARRIHRGSQVLTASLRMRHRVAFCAGAWGRPSGEPSATKGSRSMSRRLRPHRSLGLCRQDDVPSLAGNRYAVTRDLAARFEQPRLIDWRNGGRGLVAHVNPDGLPIPLFSVIC